MSVCADVKGRHLHSTTHRHTKPKGDDPLLRAVLRRKEKRRGRPDTFSLFYDRADIFLLSRLPRGAMYKIPGFPSRSPSYLRSSNYIDCKICEHFPSVCSHPRSTDEGKRVWRRHAATTASVWGGGGSLEWTEKKTSLRFFPRSKPLGDDVAVFVARGECVCVVAADDRALGVASDAAINPCRGRLHLVEAAIRYAEWDRGWGCTPGIGEGIFAFLLSRRSRMLSSRHFCCCRGVMRAWAHKKKAVDASLSPGEREKGRACGEGPSGAMGATDSL